MSYSVAITRVPLVSTAGIYRLTRRKGEQTFVQGQVTLNIVDKRLNSVTVKPVVGKAVNIPARRLGSTGLNIMASEGDRLTYAAFTR